MHTMEFEAAVKNNEGAFYVLIWKNLQNTEQICITAFLIGMFCVKLEKLDAVFICAFICIKNF